MKTVYWVLLPGAPAERREVDWPEEPGYEMIRALVEPLLGGNNLEHVYVWDRLQTPPKAMDLFVDETGLLKGLPINHHPHLYPGDIYGPAVLFERKIWF
jgi:hypothetical protein